MRGCNKTLSDELLVYARPNPVDPANEAASETSRAYTNIDGALLLVFAYANRF